MRKAFSEAARWVSDTMGTPTAFMLALGFVVVWGATGPLFQFSSAWQLVINTGTTIVTFLMVFIIQNAANRDQKALQLKLDELLRAVTTARTGFADIENLDDEALEALEKGFASLHQKHGVEIERALELGRVEADEAKQVVGEEPHAPATKKPRKRRRAKSAATRANEG